MINFYTIRCLFCESTLKNNEHILCAYCEQSCHLPENLESHYCATCSNTLSKADSVCGRCLSNSPPWKLLVCFSDYQGSLKWLIKQFKYQNKLYLAPLLGRFLYSKIKALDDNDRPDAIVPMPSHWTRHWHRGFNQSYIIAKLLSRATVIPLISQGVKRSRRTPALEGLNRKQRRSVVSNAFSVSVQLPNHVAIVDDVFTTGSSAESLAKILIRHGVQRVDLWVLARTPEKR